MDGQRPWPACPSHAIAHPDDPESPPCQRAGKQASNRASSHAVPRDSGVRASCRGCNRRLRRRAHNYSQLVIPEWMGPFGASQASTVARANWRIRSPYASYPDATKRPSGSCR
jgi:hypothetical protein